MDETSGVFDRPLQMHAIIQPGTQHNLAMKLDTACVSLSIFSIRPSYSALPSSHRSEIGSVAWTEM